MSFWRLCRFLASFNHLNIYTTSWRSNIDKTNTLLPCLNHLNHISHGFIGSSFMNRFENNFNTLMRFLSILFSLSIIQEPRWCLNNLNIDTLDHCSCFVTLFNKTQEIVSVLFLWQPVVITLFQASYLVLTNC